MIPTHILALREDSKNYRCRGLIYYCSADPYVILPKRWAWMGWTFNFAHPKVWHMIFYSIFATIVPVLFFIYLTHMNEWPMYVLYIVIAIHFILLGLWAYKASTVDLNEN